MKLEVTAIRNRRRAGFVFTAGEATIVHLDMDQGGPEAAEALAALLGDPVLRVARLPDAGSNALETDHEDTTPRQPAPPTGMSKQRRKATGA